jgi:hypothetical protein
MVGSLLALLADRHEQGDWMTHRGCTSLGSRPWTDASDSRSENEPQLWRIQLSATSLVSAPHYRGNQLSDFLDSFAAFLGSTVSERFDALLLPSRCDIGTSLAEIFGGRPDSRTRRNDAGKGGRVSASSRDCLGCKEGMICRTKMCREKEG